MNISSSMFFLSRIIAIIMLFFATGIHPYSYYMVLKCIVFVLSLYTAFKIFKLNILTAIKISAILLFIAVAILFNPIFRIHLNDRGLWAIIDVITAIIFIISMKFIKN